GRGLCLRRARRRRVRTYRPISANPMDGAGATGGVSVLLLSLAGSTVRLAAPLVLAALAGLYAERSGVVDIGLEGKMLAAAFAGAAAASLTGSAALGLGAGIVAAILLALLHRVAALGAGGGQIVSGHGLNLMAAGAAVEPGF